MKTLTLMPWAQTVQPFATDSIVHIHDPAMTIATWALVIATLVLVFATLYGPWRDGVRRVNEVKMNVLLHLAGFEFNGNMSMSQTWATTFNQVQILFSDNEGICEARLRLLEILNDFMKDSGQVDKARSAHTRLVELIGKELGISLKTQPLYYPTAHADREQQITDALKAVGSLPASHAATLEQMKLMTRE